MEMFEGFEDEDEDENEEEEEEDDDDDAEMSATLEQTDIADGSDENIERASKALPQLDPEAIWIPPVNSSIAQHELYTTKPTPYTYDLGNLTVYDPNPLPPFPTNADLDSTARAAAQSLIAELLTTRPIRRSADSVLINLPAPTTPLPREKSLPSAKPKTKWQEFAEKKGIAPKRKSERANLVFDEERKEWVPKWGYKGKNKEAEGEWLVEVDPEKEERDGEAGDKRREGRAARKERIKREERKRRANERRAVQGKGLAS
ncbi:RRS1-domain-containing protein [Viridothelium virens]|uniref:Ribosome biogenesis regulatory protein n=1 Tax=Viridothelium virens TaxID=1048519 RepID=A0A6A6HMG1_VIRVR|nr:RRS1-domain-containing protein [Viridothelium virens]